MIKYVETRVVMSEVPDQITLAINLSNCWFGCPGCHSPHLWGDTGNELTFYELDKLIRANDGIDCVCFMGEGSKNIHDLNRLMLHVKENYPDMKVAVFTGRDYIPDGINKEALDYIKIGHYDTKLGGLNKKTTNQRMFKIDHNTNEYVDLTSRFWIL